MEINRWSLSDSEPDIKRIYGVFSFKNTEKTLCADHPYVSYNAHYPDWSKHYAAHSPSPCLPAYGPGGKLETSKTVLDYEINLKTRPKLSDDIRVRSYTDYSILWFRDLDLGYVVNTIGVNIIKLCDGSKSIEDIASILNRNKQNICNFIVFLKEYGLLQKGYE